MTRSLITAIIILSLPTTSRAQQPWPVTLEVHLGPSRGYSSDSDSYRGSRTGALIDLLVGTRLHPADRAGAFVALSAGGRAMNIAQTDDCIIAPDGGCVPWFPAPGAFSALAGWESQSTNLRLLAGPGLMSLDHDRTLGVTARLDAAIPVFTHVSAAATVNSLFIPSWNGDRFYYVGVGAGLRIR